MWGECQNFCQVVKHASSWGEGYVCPCFSNLRVFTTTQNRQVLHSVGCRHREWKRPTQRDEIEKRTPLLPGSVVMKFACEQEGCCWEMSGRRTRVSWSRDESLQSMCYRVSRVQGTRSCAWPVPRPDQTQELVEVQRAVAVVGDGEVLM